MDKIYKDKVIEFVKEVCSILDIQIPILYENDSDFLSETQLAYTDGLVLYIKPQSELTPDLFFAIAHELRHLWQIETNEAYYFDEYKKVGELDTDSYNMQIAELDANAFAQIVMTDFFHIAPLWEGLSDEVREAICDYADKIAVS